MNERSPDRPLSQIFRAARELLDNPRCWTRKAQARDRRGRKVAPSSPLALRFDIEGAVAVSAGGVLYPQMLRLLDLASVQLYGDFHPWEKEKPFWEPNSHRRKDVDREIQAMTLERAVEVNDKLGYKAVLRVLDRAAALAVQEEME
jgi:hypothetical protein